MVGKGCNFQFCTISLGFSPPSSQKLITISKGRARNIDIVLYFFFFQSIANRSLIPLYHRERIKAGYTDPRTIDLIVFSFTPPPPVSLYHRLFVSATWKKVIRRLINAGANVICSQVSLESLDSAVVERARAEEWSFCEKERR